MSRGYPKDPRVEVKINDNLYLMTKFEIDSFLGFNDIERALYRKRYKEARQRSAEVVDYQGSFLTTVDYIRRSK